jgi:hypothetical protein
MKSDKPYCAGGFLLRGDEVMTLKSTRPETPFKPVAEWSDPDVAEHTEPWMDNSAERLNRSTATLLRGTLEGGMTRYFEQRAQRATWWYSEDWSVIYVATDWMDYKLPEPENGLSPHIARL